MTTKMNPEVKAAWLAALREPDRKQTKHLLRDGDGMCCLGVLCDVVIGMNNTLGRWISGSGNESGIALIESPTVTVNGVTTNESTLTKVIAEFSGLEKDNPMILMTTEEHTLFLSLANSDSSAFRTLAELNDAGFTFAQIATIIEREL